MEGTEVRKLAALEDRHWWYRERRRLLADAVAGMAPGTALDVGAAGGGGTRVLLDAGWRAVALEYGPDGSAICAERAVPVVRGDAARLPLADTSCDLVVAFDVLEHLQDDVAAVGEVRRVLRPGGTFLVAVPADPALWSAHDEAVGHVRRYTRRALVDAVSTGGLRVDAVRSWNVLLRPAVALRRRRSTGSDLDAVPAWLNAVLGGVVAAERVLPVGRLPGVSLLLRATRPQAVPAVLAADGPR